MVKSTSTPYPLPPARSPNAAFPETIPWRVPLAELAGLWLQINCDCGRSAYHPLRLLAAKLGWKRQLVDILPRLRCADCGGRPGEVVLVDRADADARKGPSPRALWLRRPEPE